MNGRICDEFNFSTWPKTYFFLIKLSTLLVLSQGWIFPKHRIFSLYLLFWISQEIVHLTISDPAWQDATDGQCWLDGMLIPPLTWIVIIFSRPGSYCVYPKSSYDLDMIVVYGIWEILLNSATHAIWYFLSNFWHVHRRRYFFQLAAQICGIMMYCILLRDAQ